MVPRQEGATAIGQHQPAVTVVVDVANVMGARADGWWRDRAGAALRLCQQIAALAARGLAAAVMPGGLRVPRGWVLVLEGRARDAAAAAAVTAASVRTAQVRVVAAPGSGDDAIVAEVASRPGACLVVTADRELRRRCEAAGAVVTGPGWLLGQL